MDWKKFLRQTAAQILGSVSSNLLVQLSKFAEQFREDAKKTDNPWDDIVANFICGMLGIPSPPEKIE